MNDEKNMIQLKTINATTINIGKVKPQRSPDFIRLLLVNN